MLVIPTLTWTVTPVHRPRWTADHELPTIACLGHVLCCSQCLGSRDLHWGGQISFAACACFHESAGDELSEGWTSSNDSPSILLPVQGSAASMLKFALCQSVFWICFSSRFAIAKPSVLHGKSLNLTHSPNWMQAGQPP
jgi:hypothetical protein